MLDNNNKLASNNVGEEREGIYNYLHVPYQAF